MTIIDLTNQTNRPFAPAQAMIHGTSEELDTTAARLSALSLAYIIRDAALYSISEIPPEPPPP